MWRFAGRNAAPVGAVLAAVLLTMQLQWSGIRGYELSDVLSILLFAIPTVLQRAHPTLGHPPRRSDAAGAGRPLATPDADAPPRQVTAAAAARRAHVLEPFLVHAVAVLIAVGAYVVALVLVVAQAWVPALSALIVCGLALAATPAGRGPGAPRG